MCFLCLDFSALVAGASNANVALGTRMVVGYVSFFCILATFPLTSNPCKNEVFGNFEGFEWLPFLHTNVIKVVFTDAILEGVKRVNMQLKFTTINQPVYMAKRR